MDEPPCPVREKNDLKNRFRLYLKHPTKTFRIPAEKTRKILPRQSLTGQAQRKTTDVL
jgi:hypothetical protein